MPLAVFVVTWSDELREKTTQCFVAETKMHTLLLKRDDAQTNQASAEGEGEPPIFHISVARGWVQATGCSKAHISSRSKG